MKRAEIKDAKAINAKASNVTLTKEQLHNTGRAYGGVRFWIGDVLVFPEWEDIETFSDMFLDRDGKEHSFPVVKIGVNNVVRNIPIGSFRRFYTGIDQFVEEYARINDFHRNLVNAQDDYEIVQLMAGKTFKIENLFDARLVAWSTDHKRIPYNKDDVKTFTTGRWPIFTIVEGE